ncbi:regulator of DNA class I crossover intermediates 1 [Pithys albifrons albifrons]|uniref:regulator of DNA class I crossover intermediates 1 n=1 Tax=Pithys albifrons albifrons TaxID=3385563 RepID=UPI003A5CA999
MKLLEVSSPKSSATSLDLLNLYLVNQVTTKKDNPENMNKPVHVDITEDVKTLVRGHNLKLPTSHPPTQYKSNLDVLQNRVQKQILDSRRQHLSEKVKYQHNMSQVTEQAYVGSNTEQEDKRARGFSACSLSSSGFQSSNCTQLSEENFNPKLMGNIYEQTYEEKLQNQPGNSFDREPWNTKPPSQHIFGKCDTVPQELFEPFHRLDHRNSATKKTVIMTRNELENCEGIKAPIFDFVKETAELKAPQAGSGCSFLALFEDESQPVQSNPSTKHFNLFVNQSSTDIFVIHSEVRNQITDRNFDTRKAYPAVNAKKSSVDRHLEGIFTAPEHVFPKSSNDSSARYREIHLQNSHEGQSYFIPCENKEKCANLEQIETFGYHHGQQINLKKNVQICSRKKCDDKSVKGTAWRQNQLFGFEVFTTAQESKLGVSSNFHDMETDVESPLSCQSHSYPPRQTESYLSCSSDRSEEDTANKKKYLNEQCLRTRDANLAASREVPKSSHTRTVPLQPCSSLARGVANVLQEKYSVSGATEAENKSYAAPSEGSSSHQALGRERVTRSDVWSQTERCVAEVEKADVGTQCNPLRVCSCGGSLPAARSPAGVPPSRTAAGHELPAREMPRPAGAGGGPGIAVLPSEARDLSLAGTRILEVLSYIDKMKEREKQ